MSDGKDDVDGSDWLSSQFTPTEQVPQQPPQQPAAAVPPVAAPPASAPPVFPITSPTPTRAAAPAPAAPQASAPAPNSNGGFNWGLRPGGGADAPAATPAAVAPPVATPAAAAPPVVTPPPLVTPPATTPVAPHVAPPLTPSESYSAPATPAADDPTQPFSWNDFAATQQQSTPQAAAPPGPVAAQPAASYADQPTEAYTVQPWQPTSPASPSTPQADHDPTTALDSLFGDHQFQAYEEVGVLKAVQAGPAAPTDAPVAIEREPRAPISSTQKALIGVAGGLIGVLILIAMFFLGQHIGAARAATPLPVNTGAATSTPISAGTGGPAAPGVQQWSALQGGECIQQFSSAWAVTFTVVDCASDHTAQMVFKGTLPDDAQAAYPTNTALQAEITPLCTASTAINYSVAKAVTDLEVSFSYPATTAKWINGDRTYYCFVNRQSGGNLPGDLSVPTTTTN